MNPADKALVEMVARSIEPKATDGVRVRRLHVQGLIDLIQRQDKLIVELRRQNIHAPMITSDQLGNQ